MSTLFSAQAESQRPLADRMRPQSLAEFAGQQHLVGEGKVLRLLISQGQLPSMILWGPPGTGKTTLARILAAATKAAFIQLSATSSGVKEIREAVEQARVRAQGLAPQRAVLFIDEIHRFNKSQQDALLPQVETGLITLIGATTENPSFEVNSALLSRCRVFVLEKLSPDDLQAIIRQALADSDRGLGKSGLSVGDDVIQYLANLADGDARIALNALELTERLAKPAASGVRAVDQAMVREALQKTHLLYDRDGEEHYNIISALHKSLRGGDADAALYWLGRMLEAGEDPLYVARRLIRFASEDIGLADPQALVQAVAAYQASHFIGIPECKVNLAQAVAYLAKAPKSNKLYVAYQAVQADIADQPNEPVPLHLRNAPTKLMKDLHYGKGYKYTPEYDNPEEAKQEYLPERLRGHHYLDIKKNGQ